MGVYSAGIIDDVLGRVIAFIDIDHTTHLLFSFLFGMGLVIQARSRVEGKCDGVSHLRKLFSLFIIGIVIGVFLDRTDILHIYAMLGLLFLFLVNLSTKVVLTSALLLIAAPSFGRFLLRSLSYASYFGAGRRNSLTADNIMFLPYGDLVLMRAQELLQQYGHPHVYIDYLDILPMFLFGLYAVRRGLFQDIRGNIGVIRKVMWFSLAAHLAGLGWIFVLQHPPTKGPAGSDWLFTTYRLLSLDGRSYLVELFVRPYTIQALSLFYICVIVLVLQITKVKSICLSLAGVGRLALSNYLLHSLIGTIPFFGYGLSLYGKLGIANGAAIAVLVCGFQIAVSNWWVRKFEFGPVEWLWRSVTYWKLQPFRVLIA